MEKMCACGEHQFVFDYSDGGKTFICPHCSREYVLYIDMEDDESLEVDFTLFKEPKTA